MLVVYLIFSVLQIFILPGLLCVGRLRTLDVMDRVLLSIPISFLINHILVVMLALTGHYSQSAMLGTFTVEVVVLIWLHRNTIRHLLTGQMQIPVLFPFGIDRMRHSFRSTSWVKGVVFDICLLVFFASVAFDVLYLLFVPSGQGWHGPLSWWYRQFGTVINDWDGVVSWHRWAVSWYNGEFPKGYWTYPQVLPTLYSITYKFVNTLEMYLAPKLVPVIIFALIPLTLARMAYLTRRTIGLQILLSIPVVFFLVSRTVYRDYAFSGGGDMACVYFGAICIYNLIIARRVYDKASLPDYHVLLFWLALATSTAFLVKQVGFFVTLFFPLAWVWVMRNSDIKNKFFIFCAMGFLGASIAAPWYLYIVLSSPSFKNNVTVYEPLLKSGWHLRLFAGAQMLHNQLGLWPFLISIPVLAKKQFRICLVPLMTVFVAWALFVSYDSRNLYILLPLFSFLMVYGLIGIFEFLIPLAWNLQGDRWLNTLTSLGHKIYNSYLVQPIVQSVNLLKSLHGQMVLTNQRRMVFWTITTLSVMGIFAHASTQNYAPWLLRKSYEEQMKIGGVWQINTYLYEKFRVKYAGTGTLIASDYSMMAFVPKLEEFLYHVHTTSIKDFSAAFTKKETQFILTTNCAVKDVVNYIDGGVKNGKFKPIFSAHGYSLFKIMAPENNHQEYLYLTSNASKMHTKK